VIVGLTAAIALAASSSGNGSNNSLPQFPNRSHSLPAAAVAYAGGALRVPNLSPYDLSLADDGSLYVSSQQTNIIHRIAKDGTVTVVAGTAKAGYQGDGTAATAAQLNSPGMTGWDRAGNLYLADSLNYRVRKIDPSGQISTVAGTGQAGYTGDGGLAVNAEINEVEELAVAPDGTLYLADYKNNRIRKVTPNGIISTVAGTGSSGYTPGPVPAVSAQLNGPDDLALADDGTLYFSNLGSSTIQKIDPTGTLTTVAGTGTGGNTGDNGPATSAEISNPSVFLGRDGNIYLSDYDHDVIRKINTDGIITTVAGTGQSGSSGDAGPATQAQLKNPTSVVVDASGAIYIADSGNNSVRRVDPNGTMITIARQAS
jgi:serine/threonine-protein kinase